MTYEATVYLGETDQDLAADKARRIYDHLGPEFFKGLPFQSPSNVILWLETTLLGNDLRVDFENKEDAILFKLIFGGK